MHIQGDDKSLTLGAKLDVDREGCLLVFKRHQKPTTVHAFSDKINFQQNTYFDCRVFITTVHYFGYKSVQIPIFCLMHTYMNV